MMKFREVKLKTFKADGGFRFLIQIGFLTMVIDQFSVFATPHDNVLLDLFVKSISLFCIAVLLRFMWITGKDDPL